MTVADRPIAFSAAMALAVANGTKTETRRLPTPGQFRFFSGSPPPTCPDAEYLARALVDAQDFRFLNLGDQPTALTWQAKAFDNQAADLTTWVAWIRPAICDTLWVREPIRKSSGGMIEYASDSAWCIDDPWRWKPDALAGRYMPRELCRTRLTVTGIAIERLQSIGESDALREGVFVEMGEKLPTAIGPYRKLWDSLHKEPATQWDANPWVVVIKFERVKG